MPKHKKHNADSNGDEDGEVEEANAQSMFANAIANNPALMQAVQSKLSGLVGKSSGYIESLPEPVKKRVNCLKNIQVEYSNIEGKFYQDVHDLEMKYSELFKPLYEKRKAIVTGEYEPTEEEGTWVETEEDENEEDEEKEEEKEKEEDKTEKENDTAASKTESDNADKDKEAANEEDKKESEADYKGIREFWLTAMKNVDMITDMIEPNDEPILTHLTDIKLLFSGKQGEEESDDDPKGFALEFHFSPNDFFTNSALTKSYKIQCQPDKNDPLSFEGTEIVGCTGCSIDWKKGKNVTEKIVKKKQKHKGKSQTRVVTKTVKNDSFFNFFYPPKVEEDEDAAENTEELLAADFEIGHFFRERLIPKAVLFFTGEALEDDEDEYDEEDDDELDDEDDEEDPDYAPAPGEKPQECNQQ